MFRAFLIAFLLMAPPAFATSAEDCMREFLRVIQTTHEPFKELVNSHHYDWIDPDHYISPTDTRYLFKYFSNVENDVLYLNIASKGKGLRSNRINASKMFDDMMAHFANQKTPIKVIEGQWVQGTNLDEFNYLIRQGYSKSRSARETWTGKKAASYGYTTVEIVKMIPHEHGEGYSAVVVQFFKPADAPKKNLFNSFFR